MEDPERAPQRYNRFRREVVRFFNWTASVDGQDLLERNPIDRNNVPRRKVAKKERPVPVNDDMTEMKKAAIRLDEKAGTIDLDDGREVKIGQYYNFSMVLTGAWARKGELLKLTYNDISWETGEIKLTTRKGNGQPKVHWQPVDETVMACIRDQLENSVGGQFVFENRSTRYRYTDKFGGQLHHSNEWVQRIAKEAGLKVKGSDEEWCSKNITAHGIRLGTHVFDLYPQSQIRASFTYRCELGLLADQFVRQVFLGHETRHPQPVQPHDSYQPAPGFDPFAFVDVRFDDDTVDGRPDLPAV